MDQYKFLQALFSQQAGGTPTPTPVAYPDDRTDPYGFDKRMWDDNVAPLAGGARYPYGPDDEMYDPSNPMPFYGSGNLKDPSNRNYWYTKAWQALLNSMKTPYPTPTPAPTWTPGPPTATPTPQAPYGVSTPLPLAPPPVRRRDLDQGWH